MFNFDILDILYISSKRRKIINFASKKIYNQKKKRLMVANNSNIAIIFILGTLKT